MTMNKRRSLFVTGCLMAVLVLSGSAAYAQAVAGVTDLGLDSERYTSMRATWSHAGTPSTVKEFLVRYQEITAGEDIFDPAPTAKETLKETVPVSTTGDTKYELSITGLTPGKTYIVGVLTIAPLAANNATTEDTETALTDPPTAPDDVLGLEVMAGDMTLTVMWDVTTDNGSAVTGYQVALMEKGKSWTTVRTAKQGGISTEWTISNLKNGTEYYVRARACSYSPCGDWSDRVMGMPSATATPTPTPTPPTPTPVLPLFGAIALGAGLVGAGRRRLRRRQRLLNS